MGQKLYTAVKSDNTEDAEKWLKRGADPNALGGHLVRSSTELSWVHVDILYCEL